MQMFDVEVEGIATKIDGLLDMMNVKDQGQLVCLTSS